MALEAEPPAEASVPEVAVQAPVPEPELVSEAVVEAQPEPAPALEEEPPVDFSALLESLEISTDDITIAPAVDAGPEPTFAPAEPEHEIKIDIEIHSDSVSGGVISTDSYLDDLAIDKEFEFSGELTDELSALTGADRPSRPTANVHKIPEVGESVLRRDQRVDRDTLLKIIHGIENL